ncbi:MAG: hypothetical protein U5L76_01905 [Patescibacteria group bacterium]|nr:hypothetical protein [Patescibacteria group bacterium]
MPKKNIYFLIGFIILGLIALQIPLANIIGSKQSFTLFDYMGPTTGLFLGPLYGAISVFVVKFYNILIGGQNLTWLSLLRFLPMIMAAVYLGTKTKKNALIPLICMILFIVHPQGRGAWFYALYWLIPVVSIFKKQRLLANALGATFTAHAIGSVIFLYAFNLPSAVWISLIPIVAIERGLFALGIWVSYPAFNTLLDKISQVPSLSFLKKLVNQQYTYSKKFLKKHA